MKLAELWGSRHRLS